MILPQCQMSLLNESCFDSFANIPDNSIDLIVTDPPYGIKYKDWDRIDFLNFTELWVSHALRVLKPSGTLWAFMCYENIFKFVPILSTYGIVHLDNWVIWARQKGRGAEKHLKSSREDIFHVTKTTKYTWNALKMLREVVTPYMKDGKPRGWFLDENGKRVRWTGLGNVWTYTSPFWKSKDDKQVHPAQKPYLLIERLILLSSNPGDTVYDPFMGSGTTGVVAKNTGRAFIGSETDQTYFELACNRINAR